MATLGKTALGGSSNVGSANFVFGFGPYTASENGTVTAFNWYDNNGGGTSTFTFGIYADSAGLPGSLLATSAATNWPGAPGWVTGAISLSISSGVSYWFGLNSDVGANYLYDAVGSEKLKYKANTYVAGSMPNPFGTPDGGLTQEASVYVTYTPAGGGALPFVMQLGYQRV